MFVEIIEQSQLAIEEHTLGFSQLIQNLGLYFRQGVENEVDGVDENFMGFIYCRFVLTLVKDFYFFYF